MALLLLLAGAGAASADPVLVGSDPADGATVTGGGGLVTLTFNESVGTAAVAVTMTGTSGYQAELEPPVATGAVVSQRLPALLIDDRYELAYRITAPDGRSFRGTIAFTVTGSVAAPAAGHGHGHAAEPPSVATLWPWLLGGAIVVAIIAVPVVRRLGSRG